MADEHERRAHAADLALQPFDGGQVEMVGRLVEQQDVGLGRQHAGQRGAAGLAARELRRVLLAGQAELIQQVARAVVRSSPGAEARLDIGERGRKAGKVRLLRQVADGGAGLGEARAALSASIRPGGDAQQRRFAGAVAADQAQPLAAARRRARRPR